MRLVGLVSFALVFPQSKYLACDCLLLTFLNNIESRTWLSIKTFETVNSVGFHFEKNQNA